MRFVAFLDHFLGEPGAKDRFLAGLCFLNVINSDFAIDSIVTAVLLHGHPVALDGTVFAGHVDLSDLGSHCSAFFDLRLVDCD